MKKIFFAAVALVFAAAFVGCEKEEVQTPKPKEVEVLFNVAAKGGFDAGSRAVKTDWEAGDQIFFAFKPEGADAFYGKAYSQDSVLRIQYDGLKWNIVNNLSPEALMALGSAGTFSAIHYNTNANGRVGFANTHSIGFVLTTYKGGAVLHQQAAYTVTDGKLDLGTVSLGLAFYNGDQGGQQFQISVPGLVEDPDKVYYLSIQNARYTNSTGLSLRAWGHGQILSLGFSVATGRCAYTIKDCSVGCFIGSDLACCYRYAIQDESNVTNYGTYKFVLKVYDRNKQEYKHYCYAVERGEYDSTTGLYSKVNLLPGKAYLLKEFDGDGEQVNWQLVATN